MRVTRQPEEDLRRKQPSDCRQNRQNYNDIKFTEIGGFVHFSEDEEVA